MSAVVVAVLEVLGDELQAAFAALHLLRLVGVDRGHQACNEQGTGSVLGPGMGGAMRHSQHALGALSGRYAVRPFAGIGERYREYRTTCPPWARDTSAAISVSVYESSRVSSLLPKGQNFIRSVLKGLSTFGLFQDLQHLLHTVDGNQAGNQD